MSTIQRNMTFMQNLQHTAMHGRRFRILFWPRSFAPPAVLGIAFDVSDSTSSFSIVLATLSCMIIWIISCHFAALLESLNCFSWLKIRRAEVCWDTDKLMVVFFCNGSWFKFKKVYHVNNERLTLLVLSGLYFWGITSIFEILFLKSIGSQSCTNFFNLVY